MKRIFSFLILSVLLLSLSACGDKNNTVNVKTSSATNTPPTAAASSSTITTSVTTTVSAEAQTAQSSAVKENTVT